MRPVDLAREHGLSTQAVRNYEAEGFLPPAQRTPSGYRRYTEVHAAALRAYLALVAGHGHRAAGQVMTALHAGRLDDALLVVDREHARTLRDRDTLDAVREAIAGLPTGPDDSPRAGTWTVGELARRLRVTPATLRTWESVGILAPLRDPVTGHRVFRASDTRDAELAHLLRRGGYPLDRIATVLQQVRTAGGTQALARALDDWRRRLTAQGVARLDAAARLSDYLRLAGGGPGGR
ncbi:TioE family transcriptional regulator [Micromonospora sp. R77]|uniref:TioE family transcriptional regulator n=1 Tax=Micromonospora sp. R77 TaxID=2925836 RepID=UPI001F600E0A|nr:TioE family transcriptional regulator [Micromonospora sp. R77]MCI4062293.1 TioE family transcriptional regulator [Micromonospora sp. R77]